MISIDILPSYVSDVTPGQMAESKSAQPVLDNEHQYASKTTGRRAVDHDLPHQNGMGETLQQRVKTLYKFTT